METKILLVEEQQIVREGLRRILETQSDLSVVAETGDGREAVALAAEVRPDVVLIEIHLPRLGGIDVIRRIREAHPDARCIVLSTNQSRSRVREALMAGASGYVPKSAGSKELADAIQSVRAGRSYLAPAVADDLISAITANAGSHHGETDLTSRQNQVLQLVAEGLSTKEIAAELGISLKTAQTHRAKLMHKLGVHKASGLVRYAIREGIVTA